MTPPNTPFKMVQDQNILYEILEQFRQNIASGALKKGDRLPSEREMEKSFGVSRTTVREAIKALELMGLVECVQGNGNYIASNMDNSLVHPLSLMFMLEGGTLQQVQQLRRSLEITNAGLAAGAITPEGIRQLQAICREMEQDAPPKVLAHYDTQFHLALLSAVGNPLIISIYHAVETLFQTQMVNVRDYVMHQSDQAAQINRHHRALVEALEQNNAAACVSAMVQHMDYIEEIMGQLPPHIWAGS